MRNKCFFVFCCLFCLLLQVNAQDSSKVAQRLTELLSICRNVDFSDPKTSSLGLFYKAAPYIVYQGDDEARRWKSVTNYSKPDEKEQVDIICTRINQSINQDTAYRITRFVTNKECEGIWNLVYVSYKKDGRNRNITFAFLKIGKTYAIGDID